MSRRPLHEYTADDVISWKVKADEAELEAEVEHARAKAKFEAIQGAIMDYINKSQGKPIDVAKKLMWGDQRLVVAHEEYLEVMNRYHKAVAHTRRIQDAIRLWQTVRADVRHV